MRKRYMWSLLWILYVGFVFHNSMTPAVESSAQSGFVLEQVVRAFQAIGKSDIGITEHLIRKTAHFAEYTLMGILLYQCLKQYDLMRLIRWQIHLLLGFLVPLLDETIQLFTLGRSGQISDVWLDCFGVLVGTLLMILFSGIKRKQKGEL